MQKIEIRIWDKKYKKMTYLTLSQLLDYDFYDDEIKMKSVLEDCNEAQNRFVPMLNTLLTDTHQNPLYEGDLVKSREGMTIARIVHLNHQFMPKYKTVDGKLKALSWRYVLEGRVVGNIYEGIKKP